MKYRSLDDIPSDVFADKIRELAAARGVDWLLTVPGVYELVAEELHNAAIDAFIVGPGRTRRNCALRAANSIATVDNAWRAEGPGWSIVADHRSADKIMGARRYMILPPIARALAGGAIMTLLAVARALRAADTEAVEPSALGAGGDNE